MNVWVWVGHVWSDRAQLALDHYGDRITDVSIFGWFVDATGSLSMTFDPANLAYYRAKWPHIRWWAAFRNDGLSAIFSALLASPTAQARLCADLGDVLDEYPWMHGIDIDLERGGSSANAIPAENLFRAIAKVAHDRGKKCAAALPPLTSTGSVGGEDWVRYKQLGEILDHVEIMSYDFAWSGSAPGPVSPGFWMRNVYDWAVSQIPREKVSMGIPLYSYFWVIHDYPANLGLTYRGNSGTYYAAWQYFTGYRDSIGGDGSGYLKRIAWLAFREPDSYSAWGYLGVYDWRDVYDWDTGSASGITRLTWDGKPYIVRYGKPSGDPYWTVADNSGYDTGATVTLRPRKVRDVTGELVEPQRGYTLTVEMLKRYPVAATILDDNASTDGQLANMYTQPSGSWSRWTNGTDYHQYRGSGFLRFNHDFTGRSLYVEIRAQFSGDGWAGVTARGITAEAHPSGQVRIRQGSTILQTASVSSRPVGSAAGSGRFYIGLRVREGSARAYFGLSDTSELPKVCHVAVTPTGGDAGIVAESTLWVDRVYLGDGWFYQPREKVILGIGSEEYAFGGIPRTGIVWSGNSFRPVADVDEWETRSSGYSLDWVYEHWKDAPVVTGAATPVRIRAYDHDVWVGRLVLCDRDGAMIAYWSDAETVVHWRDEAELTWGLDGIALWTLGQEDMRLWERLSGGELPPETKRLDI